MLWYPPAARPLSRIASACASMFVAVGPCRMKLQLLQPIKGVRPTPLSCAWAAGISTSTASGTVRTTAVRAFVSLRIGGLPGGIEQTSTRSNATQRHPGNQADRLMKSAAGCLPPGLVPGYDIFGGGQHRLSTLAAHLLRQAGHVAPHTGEPFSEAMVAGLAGGIGFMYAVFEYTGWPPMMTIVAQHHPEPWLPAVLGRLGVGYTEE